jgi:virginiamycin B lyase
LKPQAAKWEFIENSFRDQDPKTGEVTEYPMPDPQARDPHSLVLDQRGRLWFTVESGTFVGRLEPRSGDITFKSSPTPAKST